MKQRIYNVLTTYYSHNETFKLVKHEETNRILAINTKYINQDGTINRELRGYEMYMSETTAECLDRIEKQFLRDELVAQGYSETAAIVLSNGGTLKEARKLEEATAKYLSETN